MKFSALLMRGHGTFTDFFLGRSFKDDEKSNYDKRLDVYFQKHAWLDEEVNTRWLHNRGVSP